MFIVVGLPGAGKSTVISKAKESGYNIINYGDVMFELGRKRHNIKSRDDLRRLKRDEYIRIQRDAAKLICTRSDEKTIIDTHAVVFTEDGYLPGLPYLILKEFGAVSHIILITASYEDIIRRREKDAGIRRRDTLTKEEFERQSEITLSLVSAYSFYTGAHVVIIENNEGQLDLTVKRFKSVIENC